MKKSLILLSSGLDSLVNLKIALNKTKVVLALTFNYGQKASKKEILYSKKICKFYEVPHKVISLPWLKSISDTSLTNKNKKVPKPSLKNLENIDLVHSVWIPNRNGVFVNIAASFAEAMNIDLILFGANKEEGRTFKDNTQEFINASNNFFKYSSQKKIKLNSFTTQLEKKEIVEILLKKKIPLHFIWSCYEVGKKMCGKCVSCLRLKNALSSFIPRSKIMFLFSS
ncbi:MAG: 7-cyano-7-deazaguanine synthase QueC [bacterium]